MLNAEVARELARAAELLLMLTPAPQGANGVQTFGSLFEQRYPDGTYARLIDALDPIDGIGSVAHEHGANNPDQQRHSDALMTLALDALRDGSREIELDDTLVARLQTCTPSPENIPAPIELNAFVIARVRGPIWTAVTSKF